MSGRYGYANGDPDTGRSDRYNGLYEAENPSSGSVNTYGSRDRRAGGYGGLGDTPSRMNNESPYRGGYGESDTPTWQRGGRRDAEYSDSSRSRDRSNGVNGTRGYGSPRGGQRMEDVLQYINSEWPFMGGDDCVPVKVGLQLMDDSSLGLARREQEFQQTYDDLQKSLKAIVNEHHQGFNSSIGTYHKIQSGIQGSQNQVRILKSSLAEAKESLLVTKPDLKGLATSSQSFDDTLQLFTQIESIQAVPENLEGSISEKRFLTAVDILQDALRLVRRSDYDDIGGISDLRSYFANQELSITDILVEELHDHLYLKSPYCQDRWKPNASDTESSETADRLATPTTSFWDRPIFRYLTNLDTKTEMQEDASRNPESDTFYYIHMLLEALNKIGHLETAVTRIEQRLPVELFQVVDKTNAEIDHRYPTHVRGKSGKEKRTTAVLTETGDGRGTVLSDFLWTLYNKFTAIAEGHRLVHEVLAGIAVREKLQNLDFFLRGFKELWKLYQSEIRSLLHDYLATDGEVSYRSGMTTSDTGNVFSRSQRDRNKRMFKLSEMDQKSADMKTEQEDLDEILRSSVPGLVSKSRPKSGLTSDPSRAQDSSAAGHKLLIEPGVFNMTLLLPPSLSFLQRLRDVVPHDSELPQSALTSFLDDFLINVFHPQLDEAVSELCTQSFIDLEAFSEDSQWSRVSPKPIFKGTIVFVDLIWAFSKMLDSIPHDQIFTELIISQLVTYYDKCFGWYKALVTRLQPQAPGGISLKAAAAMAEAGDVHDAVVKLWKSPEQGRTALVKEEIRLLVSRTKEHPLEAYDIISDPKSVVALSLLYNSMQWLCSRLRQLRHITSATTDSRHSRTRRWTMVTNLKSTNAAASQQVYLPMTKESVAAFDTTIQSLQNLAMTSLYTLQIDIRCGIIHMLTQCLAGPTTSEAPYHVLANVPTSASPTILELNGDLIAFDTNTSAYLGRKERRFITSGLGRLIDHVIVADASQIGVLNANGAARLQLDILVLQQNLKNIVIVGRVPDSRKPLPVPPGGSDPAVPEEEDMALKRSERFIEWFLEGPEKVVEHATAEKGNTGFTYDELKILVELCFSEGMRSENREESVKAKKGLNDCLLRLSEVMWDS